MPGYRTKQECIAVEGVDDLIIRSLADHQQYSDPRDEALGLGISSATWPIFGLLWPSAAQLAARLAARPVSANERILEIGCGLALASLVGHRRGANVTASDCHPLTESFLKENLRLNSLTPMKYRHGHWTNPAHPPVHNEDPARQLVLGQYDLIIGSDLLYERDPIGTMACFIAHHAAPAGEVWIVDPNRSNRSAFNQHMHSRGFSMREERLDRPASVGTSAYRGRLMIYWRD